MSLDCVKKGLYLFFLLSLPVLAQKEASIWYFGDHAGLDFSNCDPVALTDGQLNQLEGCATISDSDGNLLFYTDGIEVYNANHNIMPNGIGLYGDPSSSQSAIIVPNPVDTSLYYIFTVDNNAGQNGLNYSTVDMDLDGGLGGIVTGKKNVPLNPFVAEKLTAVHHANGGDIWVIAHELDTNNYLAYLVTGSGVNSIPVVSAVGDIHLSAGVGAGAIGYLKASPDGTKLACAKGFLDSGVELFDFDNATGVVSNQQKINDFGAYGVEFSPNSELLYITSPAFAGKIFQYDISLPDLQSIKQSETEIATDYKYASLQLAVNGKIYAAQTNLQGDPLYNTLSVINNPNNHGTACNFVEDAISLSGKYSRCGLPPFIQSYFMYEIAYAGNPCNGEEMEFEINTRTQLSSINWDFGDPASSQNTATGISATHIFSAPGTYTVTANLVTSVNCPITLTREVTVNPIPELHQPDNLVQCGENLFDLTQVLDEILGSNQNPSDFIITYYETQPDAEAGVPGTEISSPTNYTTATLPQQTIFVRVENEYGCYDNTSFDIIVNPKAEVDISSYDEMSICVDLNPDTPVIGGNYEPIQIDTGLSEEDYIFEWSLDGNLLPETESSITASVSGEYSVIITNVSSTDPSCSSTSTATIIESNPPEFDVEAVFFEGKIIISKVSGIGDYEFSIDQNSWTALGGNNSLVLTTSQTGSVKVFGHDRNGCGTTVKEIWMLGFMKFFTPNQDGFNDRWKVLGLAGQPEANLYIFDRYGKLLASLNPSGPGWNGLYSGRPMPANDYWFRLEYKSPEGTPKVYQDNFTLMR